MEITEVRIKLVDASGEKLLAFCSITFDDCFVVRDLKIIGGTTGPFVAMPSRKLTSHCPRPSCGAKNHLKANYCNNCGQALNSDRTVKDSDGRTKLYADIAHPINTTCREMIQNRVVAEYRAELERAEQPGYQSKYDEYELDVPAAPQRPTTPGAATQSPAKQRTETRANHHIQPARAEPPPPHARREPQPTQQEQKVNTPQHRADNPDFGAGIFEGPSQ